MFPYEPRSKNYYEDGDYDASQSSWDWLFILCFPVIVLISFLIGIASLLIGAGYFLNYVYSTLIKTIASGELAYPFLAKAGVGVAYILACFLLTHSDTPFKPSLIIILSIGFVLFFTVLPTIALGLHWLRRIHLLTSTKLGRIKTWGIYSILGVGLVTIIFYQGCSK